MIAPRTHGSPNPKVCAAIVVAMLAMVVVPAAITLHSVRVPPPAMPVDQAATPHGYTVSLLLFLVPILLIGGWFVPSEQLHIPKRAFRWTLAILVPLGFLLDFVFAQWFFVYPNAGATLGIPAPALGRPVPIEEYVFYFTGFLAVLLLYVWLGEFWLAAYNVADYRGEAKLIGRLLRFHPTSLLLAGILIGGAWFYKKHLALAGDQLGFPGYFTFLVLGALVPAVTFFPVARRFVNWRALSLTLFLIVLISFALGSNAGSSIQLVELSAPPNDWSVHRSLVRLAHRRGLRLDRGDLCNGNRLRSHEGLAMVRAFPARNAHWRIFKTEIGCTLSSSSRWRQLICFGPSCTLCS